MKIEEIHICNWRSIRNLQIKFQDLMIFIGQNNHGKSNILSSVLFFFGEIKVDTLDFNQGSQELYVEITFCDLDDTDKTTFKKYVTTDNKITVRKTASYIDGNFEYKGYIQNPVDEWLQEAKASDYAKREIAKLQPFYPLLPPNGRLKEQDIIDAQTKYIEQNRNSIEFKFQLEETNFLGYKSVARGIFGDVYFIPAVKDALDDFSSKKEAIFSKLYSKMIDSMSATNPDLKEAKDKFSSLFSVLNQLDSDGKHNQNRPKEFVDFEKSLNKELESWGAEIDVEITPPNISDVLRANAQIWVNDGVRTDIARKGHGLQRALIFALIKVIADSSKKNKEESEKSTNRTASASTYFILEEPELYLHPQAQRALLDSLVTLSESKNQVLLTTHASALVDIGRYKSICIVKKDDELTGTKVYQCTDELFTRDNKKNFNLSYWINPDRSELFFAKRVILVEGPTEKTVIPSLAKKVGVFRYDYTLVDCGTKSNIPLYCLLLNKFRIPYVAVYDKDHQADKNSEAISDADKQSKLIEKEIDKTIGLSVIFVNDIEEEIGMPPRDGNKKSKPYAALTHVSAPEFEISSELKAKIGSLYQCKDSREV